VATPPPPCPRMPDMTATLATPLIRPASRPRTRGILRSAEADSGTESQSLKFWRGL
jgi:hypothetical protein